MPGSGESTREEVGCGGNEDVKTVFCPGLKKGMVLLEEKGHFCSRNYILRALSRA